MLPSVSAEFTVGTDPELRFTTGGTAVAEFRAVATARKKNAAGEWEDGDSTWVTVTSFNQLAENVVESIEKGAKVLVLGRLAVEEWTDSDNNKRTTTKVIADNIGPGLRFATAKVTKTERTGGGEQQQRSRQPAQPADDPWAVPPGPGPSNDDPPF